MNIILDAPLPISAISRKDYDNKILYVFLIFMMFMVGMGLLFVDLTKASKNNDLPTVEKPTTIQHSENV